MHLDPKFFALKLNMSKSIYLILKYPCYVQVFAKGVDKDTVVLMAARASRTENQDAIDTAIMSMLGDPKEVFYCCMIILL